MINYVYTRHENVNVFLPEYAMTPKGLRTYLPLYSLDPVNDICLTGLQGESDTGDYIQIILQHVVISAKAIRSSDDRNHDRYQ
jgi:hypothetical protein